MKHDTNKHKSEHWVGDMPMIYTALGDSITFGKDASSMVNAYPRLIVSALNTRSRKVTGYVLARSGWSSNNLLDAVLVRGASMIHQSDVVSIWIGGVDLANAAISSLRSQSPLPAKQLATNYSRNLGSLLTLIKKRSRARIICCTQYNPFPNSPLAVESISQFNRIIQDSARRYDATVAPAHMWFEGNQANLIYGYRNGKIEDALSGSLPIHPNDRGHRLIATRLSPYLIPVR